MTAQKFVRRKPGTLMSSPSALTLPNVVAGLRLIPSANASMIHCSNWSTRRWCATQSMSRHPRRRVRECRDCAGNRAQRWRINFEVQISAAVSWGKTHVVEHCAEVEQLRIIANGLARTGQCRPRKNATAVMIKQVGSITRTNCVAASAIALSGIAVPAMDSLMHESLFKWHRVLHLLPATSAPPMLVLSNCV